MHQLPSRRWLLLTVFVTVTTPTLLPAIAADIDNTNEEYALPASVDDAEKEQNIFDKASVRTYSLAGGIRHSTKGLPEGVYFRKGRLLTQFEVEVIEDERETIGESEGDEGASEVKAERKEVTRTSWEEFGTIPPDVPETKEKAKTPTEVKSSMTSPAPTSPPPETGEAPDEELKDLTEPPEVVKTIMEVKLEGPAPTPETKSEFGVDPSLGEKQKQPVAQPDQEPSLDKTQDQPVVQPDEESSSLSLEEPSPASESLEEDDDWDEPSVSPDIEESIPSITPRDTSDRMAIPSIAPEDTDLEEHTTLSFEPGPAPYPAPGVEDPIPIPAPKPSIPTAIAKPVEQKDLHDAVARAPSMFEIVEVPVERPAGIDFTSRHPPKALDWHHETSVPEANDTIDTSHRHPVPREDIPCGCPPIRETECTSGPGRHQEETIRPEAVPAPLSSNNTLYYSPLSECSQVCAQAGESYQERAITCRNFAGMPVPLTECLLPPDFQKQFFVKCNTHICGPRHYIILFDWSLCPDTCATVAKNGTVLPNYRTRDYECRNVEDDGVTAKEDCNLFVEDLNFTLRSPCHSLPCERYLYRTSNWSDCDCRSWKRHRDVRCLHWNTGREVNASVCRRYGLQMPKREEYCYPTSCFDRPHARRLLTNNDLCKFTHCSTKGVCSGGRCLCQNGFDGIDCQMDKDNATGCSLPSLLDAEGVCCASGVFDLDGACCKDRDGVAELDIDGYCCEGFLDACGGCHDRPQYIDAVMQCCKVLDASGTCCASGVIDECGICDGLGGSCETKISIAVVPDARTNIDNCGKELRRAVKDALNTERVVMNVKEKGALYFSFSKTHVTTTTGMISSTLERIVARRRINQVCQVDDISIRKLPICGNNFCEIGELQGCPQDCDYQTKMCSVQYLRGRPRMCHGHGQCSFIDGSQCLCHTGYDGSNCGDCRPGFFHVGDDRRCVPTESMIHRPNIASAHRQAAAPKDRPQGSEEGSRRNGHDYWHYWPVYAYCLLLLACLILFLVHRRQTSEEEGTERRGHARKWSILDLVYDPAWTSVKDKEPLLDPSPSVPPIVSVAHSP